MKPRSFPIARLSFPLASALAALFAVSSAQAATYYWDNNGTTAGFGAATGTWDAAGTVGSGTQGWGTDATGLIAPTGTITTASTNATTDAINFGTATAGLSAGTITVAGTVQAGAITFGAASGAIVLSGGTAINLTAASTVTVNNATNTIDTALTGAATSFTKAGSGILVLTGTNTYSGATTISGGTLRVSTLADAGSNSNLGNFATAGATGILLNGGRLQYTGASGVSVNRGFTVTNNSTVDIDAASTSLTLGASSIGAFTLNVTSGGTGSSLGLGALILTGAAVLNPTTANLTVASVTATNLGLTLGGTSSGNTVTGAINTGTGTLTKNTASTWTLSGSNGYTGATNVSAGLLRVDGSLNSGSAVTVSAGAIGGTGTVNGSLSLTTNGGINLANGSVGGTAFTVGGTLLSSGAAGLNNLTFDLASGGSTTDTIVASGAFDMNTAGAVVVNVNQLGGSGNRLTANTYDILTAASGSALSVANGGNFRLATTKAFGQTFSLGSSTSTILKLTTTQVAAGALNKTLSVAAGSWAAGASFGGTVPDYQSNVTINSATGTTPLDGSTDINSLTYGTSATAATTISAGTASAGTIASMLVIEAATVNGNTAPNGITLSNTSGTHTISANVGLAASQTWTVATGAGLTVSGVISDFGGGYGLTKEGGGTLTLSGVNTFSGPLTIANGTVRADGNSPKGTNGLLGAGTTLVMGSNGQTGRLAILFDSFPNIDKDITLATGGTGEFQFGNLGSFNITNTDRTLTLSGNISGSGNFTKLGGATIILSGNNTYTGTTTVNEGALRLSSATALPGGIGATGGTSALTINGNGTINLGAVVSLTAASGDFRRGLGTGADQFQITGGVSGFEANGSARQVIVGNDAAFELQWGIATFNPSALLLGYNQVTATGALTLQNKIDLNAATRTVQVNTGAAISTISGDIRTSSGTAGLTKTGGGTLALSGSNTYNGPTTINAGTLIISGNHIGNGSTTVNAGTLTLSGASGSIGSSAVTIVGGTLTISNANAASNSDRLSGSLAFSMNGGTFNFNNDASVGNSFSEGVGTLTLVGGVNTVAIQQAIAGQTSTLTFAGLSRTAGTLNFSGAGLGTAVDPRSKITFTSAPTLTNGIIGTWATVNGLGYATLSGNDVVLYNTYADVNRGTGGTKAIADGSTTDVRIIEAGAATNITLGATTTTVRSILNSVSGGVAATTTIAIGASETLRVDSINAVATTLAMNVGNVANTGTLTSATAGGNLLLINSSANTMTVNSVIANNTSASSLTKDGTGRLTLTAAPTYTGATTIQGGTFDVSAIVGGGSNITPLATSSIAFTTANSTFMAAGSGTAITSYPTMSIASGVTATFDRGGGGNNTAFAIPSLTGGGTFRATNSGGAGTNITFTTLAGFTGNLELFNAVGNAINTPDLNDAASSKILMSSSNTGSIPSFNYTGSSGLTLTNRQFELNGTSANAPYAINNNGTGTFTINSNLLVSATGNKILNLGGTNTTANNTFGGTISDGTGAAISVTKSGASSWALTNTNTYTGVTTVSAGTLEVSSLANGLSASSIGASSSAAGNLVLNGGTLRYTGAAVSTDRLFSLQGSSTINASGTGAVNFTNTGSMGFNGGAAAKTLTLTGTNTGDNTIAAVIGNLTAATAITKSGIGTWVLSGSNTNTGATGLNGGGALVLDYGTSDTNKIDGVLTLGGVSASLFGGGTLTLKGATGAHVEVVTSTSLNAGGTFLIRDVNGGSNTLKLRMNAITRAAGGTISFGDATLADTDTNNVNSILGGYATLGNDWAVSVNSGAADTAVTALGTYSTWVNTTGSATANYLLNNGLGSIVTAGVAANTVKIMNSANSETLALNNLNLTITAASANSLGGIMYAGGNDNLYSITGGTGRIVTSGTNQELVFAVQTGTLSVGAFVGASGSTGPVTKSGAGTLAISSLNNYTGATYVNQGVLQLRSATAAGTATNTLNAGIIVQNNAALELANSAIIGTEALTITGTGVSNAGALRNVASNTSSYAGAITIGTGGARINSDVSGSLTLSGGVVTSQFNNVTFGGAGNTTVQTVAISGAGGLIKDGVGTTTLATGTTHTYTGATTVSDGTLVVNGNISTSVLTTVQTGATLGGSGSVGALTIDVGGFHNPGNSPAIQNTGNYSLAGSLGIEITGNTPGVGGYDQVNTTGSVTLSGLLAVTMSYTPGANELFFILVNDGSDAVVGTFSNAPTDGSTYTLGGQDFQISYFGNQTSPGVGTFDGGNDVVLMAIPEPNVAALLGSLGALMLLRRRR